MNTIELVHNDTVNEVEARLIVTYNPNSDDSKAAAWSQIESFVTDHVGGRPNDRK